MYETMSHKLHMIPKTIWELMTLACTATSSSFLVALGENDPSSAEAKNEGDDETSVEIQRISTSTPRGRAAAKGALTSTFHPTPQHCRPSCVRLWKHERCEEGQIVLAYGQERKGSSKQGIINVALKKTMVEATQKSRKIYVKGLQMHYVVHMFKYTYVEPLAIVLKWNSCH